MTGHISNTGTVYTLQQIVIHFKFQFQKEGIHLVTVTSNLLENSTIQPQWLTE